MARVLRSTVARLIITAAILTYLLWDIDLGQMAGAMLAVDSWWLVGTLGLVAMDRVLMIVRWVLLLRSAGVHLSVKSSIHIFLVSSFVGSFLPAGVGGDASRAYAVAARTTKGAEAVASVAIDRVLGLVAIVVLGAVGLADWAQRLEAGLRWRVTMLGAGVGVLALATLWTDCFVRVVVRPQWRETRWGRRVIRLGEAIGLYRQRHGTLAVVFGLSVIVQAVRVLQGYGLGRGMGIDVDLAYYLVFMPVGLLLMLLPVSISGFGLPQGVIVWLLEPVGVSRPDAFALSTLIVAMGLVGNLPGAFLYLRRKKPIT